MDYTIVQYKLLNGALHCFASTTLASGDRSQLFNGFVDTDVSHPQCHDWLLYAFDDFDGGYSKSYRIGEHLVLFTADAYRFVETLFKEVSK